MSKTIKVSTIINAPLKTVWNEVSRLENHTNWMNDAEKIDFYLKITLELVQK